jgi:YfiH family protein
VPELLYRPDWKLPRGVHAFVTTREGGKSAGAWSSFNLAQHAGDAPDAVNANRALLLERLRAETGAAIPAVQWVSQVHGTRVFHAGRTPVKAPQADAIFGSDTPLALGILTADCLPVLFASDDGRAIAVAHAGWRGLLGGVLEATLASFRAEPAAISAWLGPAIGPCHFEVGGEVRSAFVEQAVASEQSATAAAFAAAPAAGKWMADLYQLAHLRLRAHGVNRISGSPSCTVCQEQRFYSYRRNAVTGRFATLIVNVGS